MDNAAIDSGALTLDLSMANFTIPQGFSGRTLELFIDNRSLVRKNVNVSIGFSFDLQPKFAAFARDTGFTITPSNNISRATWSFGDGSAAQSSQGRYDAPSLQYARFIRNYSGCNKYNWSDEQASI